MKKILVNVNEENLELVREQWRGVRGYRLSNSDIVNELLAKEVMLKVLKQARFTSTPSKEKRTSLRTLMDAYKEQAK
ncbi:hypothetical protein [Fibrobacter sp.]|uniref:hypothetical protein n=1 Tax=Fibrobacter sp. TaxID=35828 RepID=UPI0025BD7B96|nr:hypothetical protein [Fibrobacter sp.]MBR3073629.1 hypothetical protein [Fibrobacter sp.]